MIIIAVEGSGTPGASLVVIAPWLSRQTLPAVPSIKHHRDKKQFLHRTNFSAIVYALARLYSPHFFTVLSIPAIV